MSTSVSSVNSEQTVTLCLWLSNDKKLHNKYAGLSAVEIAVAFRDEVIASCLSAPLKEMLTNALDRVDFDEVCASLCGYEYCTRCSKAREDADNCHCNACTDLEAFSHECGKCGKSLDICGGCDNNVGGFKDLGRINLYFFDGRCRPEQDGNLAREILAEAWDLEQDDRLCDESEEEAIQRIERSDKTGNLLHVVIEKRKGFWCIIEGPFLVKEYA